jgi:hypothetical protein
MMMKKIYGTITILILTVAMIAMAACSNVLEPPQPKREAETGTVYIIIDGDSSGDRAAARTLIPDQTNFIRYTASFSGPETYDDVDVAVGSTSVSLVPGEWTVTVTAFTGANTATGRGSTAIEVLSNQTVAADITIIPITGNGRTGDFHYSVTIPAVNSATLSLTDMTANVMVSSVALKTAVDSSGGITAATLNLSAGYYRMNILLEKNGTYAGRTEVVHIYNGLVTEAVYGFTDDDFGAILGDLADGVWQGGNMTGSGSEYYRFFVTAGETYAVCWNDSDQGDGEKSLDIEVSAYYETGEAPIFGAMDKGYTTPQVFTATSSGNIIIRVEPYHSGGTGTYAVMYGKVNSLSVGTADPGAITAGGVKLYSFPADANAVYEVSWEDSGDQAGGSSYDGNITVTAYRKSGGSSYILFNPLDSGYATPRQVSYTSNTTVYLKVEGVSAGTYSVKYELSVTDSTEGLWQDGNMIASDYEYYRFPVTMGEAYVVFWNDSYEGDGTKTLNIKVSAYYETSGDFIFSGIDSGYNTPQVFSATSSDDVLLRVEPYSWGYTGTYSIKLIPDITDSVRIISPRGKQNTYVNGYRIQYTAQALRSDGSVREGVSFTYGGGADPSTGLFTPATAGTYYVTATADGKSGTSGTLTVHPVDYLRQPYYYPGNDVTYAGYAGPEGTPVTSYGGITVAYPSETTFDADGFFTLEGTVSNPAVYNYAYVAVYKGADTSNSNPLQTYYLIRDTFKTRIWLRFGSGLYTIRIYGLDSITLSSGLGAEGDYRAWSGYLSTTFTVTNTANDGAGMDGTTPDRRFIYPSYLMQSDDFLVANLASHLTYGLTDPVDKIKAIHDYLVTNTVYDMDSYNNSSMRKKQDALTVLGTRYTFDTQYPDGHYLAVCEGYANTSGALIRAAGIETKYQASDPMNHGWNHIYVDGVWKLYDATWDDPVQSTSVILDYGPTSVGYTYFLIGLTGVGGDHYNDTTDMRRSVLPTPTLPRQRGVPDGWY